jgi:hypothetical protein
MIATGDPPGVAQVLAGAGEHGAPLGGRRLGAETDIAEPGGEDRTGDADRGEDDQRGDDVRPADRDPKVAVW